MLLVLLHVIFADECFYFSTPSPLSLPSGAILNLLRHAAPQREQAEGGRDWREVCQGACVRRARNLEGSLSCNTGTARTAVEAGTRGGWWRTMSLNCRSLPPSLLAELPADRQARRPKDAKDSSFGISFALSVA